jgi:hypothetical protein
MAQGSRKQGEAKQKPDSGGGVMDQFVGQLRDVFGLATGSLQRLPSLGLPSPPDALSAAQIQTIARGVHAQRTQITAVAEQLPTLDEQLAVLERLLEPLVQWSSTWADLERAFGGLLPKGREDEAEC